MSLAETYIGAHAATFSDVIAMLRASGEPTRLRILTLLTRGELNVRDLCRALGQSQPRISRHLKLLADAGLIERRQEGSFMFFRLSDWGTIVGDAGSLLWRADRDEGHITTDMRRLDTLRAEAAEAAQGYFARHASEWDAIRALHMPEAVVETAMLERFGPARFRQLVDLGTGTGRMLEVFARQADSAIGFDINREMLSHARARLAAANLAHVQVRQGDLFDLPLADGAADGAVLHQVLHFLDEPQRAIAEAGRILRAGGRLLIVDFAPHAIEALRETHEHRRLGFATPAIAEWLAAAGLSLAGQADLRREDAAKLTVSIWLAIKDAGHA